MVIFHSYVTVYQSVVSQPTIIPFQKHHNKLHHTGQSPKRLKTFHQVFGRVSSCLLWKLERDTAPIIKTLGIKPFMDDLQIGSNKNLQILDRCSIEIVWLPEGSVWPKNKLKAISLSFKLSPTTCSATNSIIIPQGEKLMLKHWPSKNDLCRANHGDFMGWSVHKWGTGNCHFLGNCSIYGDVMGFYGMTISWLVTVASGNCGGHTQQRFHERLENRTVKPEGIQMRANFAPPDATVHAVGSSKSIEM